MKMIDNGNSNKNNNKFQVLYTTTTGKQYPLDICWNHLPSKLVPIDSEVTTEACKKGCNLYGRNGGCPPYAPMFSEISKDYMLILYAKMLTKYFPEKVLNGNYYTRWVFVETFMASLTNRIGLEITDELDGYFLSSGHCSSCRPKKCSVKIGKPCRNPTKRTYSLEATGVLVTELMKKKMGLELQWWDKRDKHLIPDYMVKVIGVTRDEIFHENQTKMVIEKALKKDRIVIQE
jgi:predicted metal-binding protein